MAKSSVSKIRFYDQSFDYTDRQAFEQYSYKEYDWDDGVRYVNKLYKMNVTPFGCLVFVLNEKVMAWNFFGTGDSYEQFFSRHVWDTPLAKQFPKRKQ